MNRVLIAKEMRQHGTWFVLLTLFYWGLTLIVVGASAATGTTAGAFANAGTSLSYFIPLPLYVVCHFLVAVDFRQKAQLFLEGLPLPRWRAVAVKAVIALVVAAVMAAGLVLMGIWRADGSEVLTPTFLSILFSSAILWAWFLIGFFFIVSFLGRYRLIIMLTIGFTLMWLAVDSRVPLSDFPPFALMHRFGFEREVWPASTLAWTGGMVALFFAVSMILGLVREGSVAAMLGESMSYREKMMIGACAVAALIAVTLWDEPAAEPFSVPGAVGEERGGIRVFFSPEDLDRPVDEDIALANDLANRLLEKVTWLGIEPEEFPDIYVIETAGLEEEKIEFEEVEGEPVTLIYAGYREEGFSRGQLLAYTMSMSLDTYSFGRVGMEHRWWIVCGFEGLWELEEADEETIAAREKMAYDTVEEYGFSVEQLLGRAAFRDAAGWREADAVAWMGFRFLKEVIGEEKLQELGRRTVVQKVDRVDSRAVIWDAMHPVRATFEKVTGLTLEEFVEGTKAYIQERAPEESGGEETAS